MLRVGTDILFSLACVHDFKQEMLATAVRDGLLEVYMQMNIAHNLDNFPLVPSSDAPLVVVKDKNMD